MRARKNMQHITEARSRLGTERFVGQNGEINAGSKKELLQKLIEISSMVSSEEIAPLEHDAEIAAERNEVFLAAYHDHTGPGWAELGSTLSGEITTRVEREGFMRTLLDKHNVDQGALPRIRVREPNVRAVRSRGVAQVYPQFVREKYVPAEEFHITAQPRIDTIELAQGSPDMLEDKYFEAVEAILVQEDRTVKALMDATAGIYNDLTYYSALTPAILGGVKTGVEKWRLPALNFLFAIDLLNDISFGTDFSTYFDPVSKYEIVMTGRIGRLFGMNLITDGFREPTLQVLDRGEFYITSAPELVGGYTDRGPVESNPVNMSDMSIPARGWNMSEIISVMVANAKAISKGKRT